MHAFHWSVSSREPEIGERVERCGGGPVGALERMHAFHWSVSSREPEIGERVERCGGGPV
ncbi:Hypothetical predicted protein, partial [Pelobates cultripes]